MFDQRTIDILKARGLLHLGKITFQKGGDGRTDIGKINLPISFIMHGDAVEPVEIGMISVITPLVLDKKGDQDAAGHSDSQAGDVDEGIGFVLSKISQCDF